MDYLYREFGDSQALIPGTSPSPPFQAEPDTTIKSSPPLKVKPPKKRKRDAEVGSKKSITRAVFTKFQQDLLEDRFRHQSFLSREERRDLAEALKLTDRQVMIWFQNRRGRLKKRGPQDKAYNPTKLQEINIRRPYPFLCGVFSTGYHQYSPDGTRPLFSMYPREVQSHIKKVIPQLPEPGQIQVSQITEEISASASAPPSQQQGGDDWVLVSSSSESGSPPLPSVDMATPFVSSIGKRAAIPPNVNLFQVENSAGPTIVTGNSDTSGSFIHSPLYSKPVNYLSQGNHMDHFFNAYGSPPHHLNSVSQYQQSMNLNSCQSMSHGAELSQQSPPTTTADSGHQNVVREEASSILSHPYGSTNGCLEQYAAPSACYYMDAGIEQGVRSYVPVNNSSTLNNLSPLNENASQFDSSKINNNTALQSTAPCLPEPYVHPTTSSYHQNSNAYGNSNFVNHSFGHFQQSPPQNLVVNNSADSLHTGSTGSLSSGPEGTKEYRNPYYAAWQHQQQCTPQQPQPGTVYSAYHPHHHVLANHGNTGHNTISCSN